MQSRLSAGRGARSEACESPEHAAGSNDTETAAEAAAPAGEDVAVLTAADIPEVEEALHAEPAPALRRFGRTKQTLRPAYQVGAGEC